MFSNLLPKTTLSQSVSLEEANNIKVLSLKQFINNAKLQWIIAWQQAFVKNQHIIFSDYPEDNPSKDDILLAWVHIFEKYWEKLVEIMLREVDYTLVIPDKVISNRRHFDMIFGLSNQERAFKSILLTAHNKLIMSNDWNMTRQDYFNNIILPLVWNYLTAKGESN